VSIGTMLLEHKMLINHEITDKAPHSNQKRKSTAMLHEINADHKYQGFNSNV
jgi:hypothetical protein